MSVAIRSKVRPGDRQTLRGAIDLYVSTTGNDTSNSGTISTSPFLTISKAFDYLKAFYFAKDCTVTINVAEGTYNITSELVMDHPQGNRITLKGPSTLVKTATEVTSYTDTTAFSGRVSRLRYAAYTPFLSSEAGGVNTGSRFIHTLNFAVDHDVSTTSAGTMVVASPHHETAVSASGIAAGELQLNHNLSSLGNYATFGLSANSTDPDRYSESEATTRRLFGVGAFQIKSSGRDFTTTKQLVLENNIRNRNPYDGVSNSNTSRVHTASDPTSVDLFSANATSIPCRHIKATISVSSGSNGVRITKGSGLKLENIAVITANPSNGTVSTKTGVLAENGSELILGNAVAVKNFKVGIAARNKSLIRQDISGSVSFNAVTYCGTGVLVSENSQAALSSFMVSGAWESAYIVNQQSEGTFTACTAVGSGLDGFVSKRNSNLIAIRSISAYNFQDAAVDFVASKEGGIGFGSRLNSNLESIGCLSFRNGFGYYTDKNSSMNLSSCDAMDNINRAVSVTECSSAVVGPYFHSSGDAVGHAISDGSSSRLYDVSFTASGQDAANGIAGSVLTTTTNSNTNVVGCNIGSYGGNAIEAIYNSTIVGNEIVISGTGTLDEINSTYGSIVRCSTSTINTSLLYKEALNTGYIEINGVEF